MAKKEYVKLTAEGLNLVTVLNYSSIVEINSFSGKEVFFSQGFQGNESFLFQALGNLGAFARNKDLDKDISVLIISNKIIDEFHEGIIDPFIEDLESKLNQNNSPYRRVKLLSEDQLIWYLENRAKTTTSKQLTEIIKLYKDSKKNVNPSLF
ncbi:hypothetical protein G7051_17620 [Dysgonomonas sp. HDW5B]|uniref:hypothetical protein n=1 Tax=Dysgonomonas sp. HDW5B TaxID=2714927 RepID=UPI00140C880F|nr:hypothetical protein [Dysgonomonas sp. HDW5B]QIK56080.1 hypothetical protein G7051_17620 [Dysgonomonas sp. HDW5B]